MKKMAPIPRMFLVLMCTSGLVCTAGVSGARARWTSGLPSRAHGIPKSETVSADESLPLTIIPQPPILQADPGQGETDSASFSLLLQATSGTALECKLDGQSVPCGPPPSTCAGSVCATFTAMGQAQGIHYLDATVTDAAGRSVDENDYAVTVDLTPPDSTNLQLNDGTDAITPRTLHPVFAFAALDDGGTPNADGPPDSGQCSFTPVGVPPVWSSCAPHKGYDDDEDFQYTPVVPAKHMDYVFQGRTVDVFGRVDPTPVSMSYDPVPCDVHVSAPHTVRRLLGTTLTATVRCTGTSSAELLLFLLGTNGHAKLLGHVLTHGTLPLVPPTQVGGSMAGFTVRHRLRVRDILRSAENAISHARSLRLAVVTYARTSFPYNPLPGSAQVTIAERGSRRDRDRPQ
jgi:hypothetical protein